MGVLLLKIEWFEYSSCKYILKCVWGEPTKLNEISFFSVSSLSTPVSVSGENKNKNPWSLRKWYSLTLLSAPNWVDAWNLLWEGHWVDLVLLVKEEKDTEKPLCMFSWCLLGRRVDSVSSALDNVLQEDLFYCHGMENGVIEELHKDSHCNSKTRTHCNHCKARKEKRGRGVWRELLCGKFWIINIWLKEISYPQ